MMLNNTKHSHTGVSAKVDEAITDVVSAKVGEVITDVEHRLAIFIEANKSFFKHIAIEDIIKISYFAGIKDYIASEQKGLEQK